MMELIVANGGDIITGVGRDILQREGRFCRQHLCCYVVEQFTISIIQPDVYRFFGIYSLVTEREFCTIASFDDSIFVLGSW